MDDTILQLNCIQKSFQNTKVLHGICLNVNKGEFITLLGPSGCGKTTTLRIIGGLETPDSGQVIISGKDVTQTEPNQRNVNTVFQNYALFPHMDVETNVGYSLKLKRVQKSSLKKAVDEALDMVRLGGFQKRMPHELSGGQKQRVAIARAIVNQPAVLLLDEPLGALDVQLRYQMQLELKRLQKRLGVTFVYITHDQEEALNMSDRIAVMKDGRFEQVGSPSEIYDSPKTSFVAQFVGSANIVEAAVTEVLGDYAVVNTPNGEGKVLKSGTDLVPGQKVTFALRRELVDLIPDIGIDSHGLRGTVTEKYYSGGVLQIFVSMTDGTELRAGRHGIDSELSPGDKVIVTWQPQNAVLVDLGEPQ